MSESDEHTTKLIGNAGSVAAHPKSLESVDGRDSRRTAGIFVGIIVVLVIVITLVAALVPELERVLQGKTINEIILFLASLLLLSLISALAAFEVRSIIAGCSGMYRRRANIIAVLIGLVLTVILFKQSYLNLIFKKDTGFYIQALLAGSGVATGWLSWYLKHLKRYGEFFHVLLLTTTIGLCWYARFTAPEEVQLTAVAFLVGSLFHVAKDYLDSEDSGQLNSITSAQEMMQLEK